MNKRILVILAIITLAAAQCPTGQFEGTSATDCPFCRDNVANCK